jgi:hypothetical protein
VLSAIEKMNSGLARIPNDRNEPMRPLSLATAPAYVKVKTLESTRTVSRIIRRYTGSSGDNTTAAKPKTTAWLPVVADAQKIGSIFDLNSIRRVCSEVTAPFVKSDGIRTFNTLLTIELLLRATPGLNSRIAFETGPRILS